MGNVEQMLQEKVNKLQRALDVKQAEALTIRNEVTAEIDRNRTITDHLTTLGQPTLIPSVIEDNLRGREATEETVADVLAQLGLL